MAAGGRDVAGVSGIITAQRAVGALDDLVGAFDDSIERRAQRLVEGMVEDSDRLRLSDRHDLAWGRVEGQMPTEPREIAGFGRQHLSRQGHLRQIILPGDGALAGKVSARGQ